MVHGDVYSQVTHSNATCRAAADTNDTKASYVSLSNLE